MQVHPAAATSGQPAAEQRLYAATPGGAERLEVPAVLGSASAAIDVVPPGVYEGLRTFGRTRFFALRSHLERLRASAAAFAAPGTQAEPLAYDEEQLVRALDDVARDASAAFDAEVRIRVDVAAAPAHVLGSTSNVLLAATPFRGLPAEIVARGARVVGAPGLARPNPDVKTSSFVRLREAWIAAHGVPGAYEYALLGRGGEVLEGTQSNIVLVRDGALYTAPRGVLPGVTVRIALDIADEAGYAVHREFVPLDDLGSFDEAFLTTSVRSLIPVSSFDDVDLDPVGPVTARLAALYAELAEGDAVEASERANARY